jgi:hypothetical protein
MMEKGRHAICQGLEASTAAHECQYTLYILHTLINTGTVCLLLLRGQSKYCC